MIVLAIIGLIVAAVSIEVFSQLKKAKVRSRRSASTKIAQATARSMPATDQAARRHRRPDRAGQVVEERRQGSLGHALHFRCPGTMDTDGADVISSGPDKQPGTEDDIKSWEY